MRNISTLFLICFSFAAWSQGFKDLNKQQYKNVHALIVGVSDYTEVRPLDFAHSDAELMHTVLSETFPDHAAKFELLTNENATQLNIVNGIRNLAAKAMEGDLVIFYFSGHGDVVNDIIDGEKGFFLAHNASNSRVYYPAGGAVEFEYVNKALTRITEKKAEVWMITDACKSGKVIEEKDAPLTMTALYNGFEKTTKFISCATHELSYEDPELEQGVFTYYLVRALSGEADTDNQKGVLNVDEINTYLKNSVRLYTNESQTPKVATSNEFKNIIATNPEFGKLIKEVANGASMSDLAMRGAGGKGDGDPKSATVKRFEELLVKGQLHSSTGFAHEVLIANSFSATKDELVTMKLLLTEALLDRGQRTTNLFLNGRPLIGPGEDFKSAQKDFSLAAELLGKEHPMYDQVLSRSAFFTAMQHIQEHKDLDKAELILKEQLNKFPDAAHIHQGLAMLYIEKSDKAKAEASLQKAAEKVPTWSKPQNSDAYLKIIAGQLKEAESILQKSQELKNNTDNHLVLKAYMHQANYELQLAEKSLAGLVNNSIYSSSEIKQIEARTNELRGRVQLAQQQYKESLNTDANNTDLLLKLADLYREEADTATALNYYERAKKIRPSDPLIQAHIDQLKKKKITSDFSTIDHSNTSTVLDVVTILENEKNYTRAIEILEKSISIKNWDPELYYLLGKLQYADGKHQSSIISLNKALELSPYHYKSIRSLAYIYLHQKNFREAEALIGKHEPYFDQSAKYLSLSFQVYKYTGSKRDLYAILEKAIQIDSLETDAYRALYQLGIEENQYESAFKDFQTLIQLGGGHNDSLDFYSRVEKQVKTMLELHNYGGQRAGAELIYKLDPLNFEFAYYYGLCAYMEGEYETAENALRTFGKAIQSFSPGVQRAYYNLKAKINLETGHPDLSERLFAMGGDNINPADYLGLAMAQFDLGKDWITNFRRAGEPLGYNEDALKRYEKMRKKAEKMGGSYGGAERMR